MVKNLPSNTGNTGSIPDQGTKISPPKEQLSLLAATRRPRTAFFFFKEAFLKKKKKIGTGERVEPAVFKEWGLQTDSKQMGN